MPRSTVDMSLDHEAVLERLWQRSSEVVGKMFTDCWVWHGGRNADHYGVMKIRLDGAERSTAHYVHRISAAVHHGLDLSNPDELALHACDNPACWNPHHLKKGDQQMNMQHMFERGRHEERLTKQDIRWIRDRARTGMGHARIAAGLRKKLGRQISYGAVRRVALGRAGRRNRNRTRKNRAEDAAYAE